jgi:MFS family permease
MEEKRSHLRFINVAHFVDHYVLLIFPTVVLGLELELNRSYGELIALSTACFVAFGLFSLPSGWLGDHWSRRKMMAIFFFGCAVSLAAAAAAPNMFWLAAALLVLGVFASIYHPVGVTLLVANARDRGRDFATNGVWGNLGVAFAPGVTALVAVTFGWRPAFALPASVCAGIGVAYLMMTEELKEKPADRVRVAEVPLTWGMMAWIFGFFALVSFAGGLVFNILTVAVPKLRTSGWRRIFRLRSSVRSRRWCFCSAASRSSRSGGWYRAFRRTSCSPGSVSCSSWALPGRQWLPARRSWPHSRSRSQQSTRRSRSATW